MPRERSEQDRVRVSVTDTGHGIGEGDLGRIFEPFFTTKEEGRGNGRGSMVAADILREHDGRIEVRSEVGHGKVFFVDLPCRDRGSTHETVPGA
jgi:two-component system, NtrC family, sensor kinase